MNLNKTFILGRLVKEVESKTIGSGTNVANLTVVTNRFTKDKDGNKKDIPEFHNVTLWGKLADVASKYLLKGQLVLIEGRIETQSWEKDGVKKYKTQIVGESIQLGPKSQNTQTTQDTGQKQDNQEIQVEDIPF